MLWFEMGEGGGIGHPPYTPLGYTPRTLMIQCLFGLKQKIGNNLEFIVHS